MITDHLHQQKNITSAVTCLSMLQSFSAVDSADSHSYELSADQCEQRRTDSRSSTLQAEQIVSLVVAGFLAG